MCDRRRWLRHDATLHGVGWVRAGYQSSRRSWNVKHNAGLGADTGFQGQRCLSWGGLCHVELLGWRSLLGSERPGCMARKYWISCEFISSRGKSKMAKIARILLKNLHWMKTHLSSLSAVARFSRHCESAVRKKGCCLSLPSLTAWSLQGGMCDISYDY